ncbi:MAG: phosphate ABC transporter ATP-binding protein [Pseudomonadales bacterium]
MNRRISMSDNATTFANEHTQSNRTAPEVSIVGLSVYYGNTAAITNATLTVPGGSLMALVGPSGCGKTSLLNCINRMNDTIADCRVEGRITIDDLDVQDPSVDVNLLRQRVGMVFQQPNPFPLSIAENIHFPLREHGVHRRAELDKRTMKVLNAVGLWDEVKDRLRSSALSLSGGQQQRLCIARALALEPEVLLLDEPCSALDPLATEQIERLIEDLKQQYTLLMVTHNLAQARRVADHVTVCWIDENCGCVVESGSRESIFINSDHPVTKAYCRGDKG